MTVRIEKPAINVREELADLRKPTGIAGEAMLRAETPQEQFNLIGAGRRNLIINGNFQVSQRGDFTSATTLTSSMVYYVDRWKARESQTTSNIEHRISQLIGDGSYANSLKLRATADGAAPVMQQYVEDYKVVWGRTFVVSFWYRSNNAWSYNMYNGTTQYHYQVPTSDNQWKKHTNVVTFPSNGTELRIEIYRFNAPTSVVSGDFFEFTQFQLELGKVATPFEHRSYGEELALCQRFYTRMGNDDGGFTHLMVGSAEGASIYVLSRTLPTGMRAVPSVTLGSGVRAFTASAGVGTVNSFNTRCTRDIACISANISTTATTGQAAVLYDSGANGYIEYDSEL